MTKLYYINIYTELNHSPMEKLFSVLERILPVKFFFNEQGRIKPAGKIFIKDIKKHNLEEKPKNIPCLSVPMQGNNATDEEKVQIEVTFTDYLDVPIPFRGRTVKTKVIENTHFLLLHQNEKVIAKNHKNPIWTISDTGMVKHYRSSLFFPKIISNGNFSDVFNGESFLEILPLIHFLREVCKTALYKTPTFRATFIIDDPNLHWPRYGFVDYRELAVHAKRENYHVSFATIPIDTWFTHTATAELFIKNSKWLSLSVHGNNHAKVELARKYTQSERISLLKQAHQRMKRLEEKTNLSVCRVIVPPHGACSEEMLADIIKCGFESACISVGSLREYNKEKSWTRKLGYFPSEVVAGCPVLPRSGLTGNIENTLLIAGYLGRPLILRGHHYDLKNGIEVIDKIAKFVNEMGNVLWMNLTNISRSNYLWRMEGGACRVKPLGNKIVIKLPSYATDVIIEELNDMNEGAWRMFSADGFSCKIKTGVQFRLPDSIGSEIFIEQAELPERDLPMLRVKTTSAWLIIRRLLTEARDRLSLLAQYKT